MRSSRDLLVGILICLKIIARRLTNEVLRTATDPEHRKWLENDLNTLRLINPTPTDNE